MNHERLNKIVSRIISLRQLTKTSGFATTRSQNAMLSGLSDAELGEVAEALRNYEMKANTNETAHQ